MFKQYLQDMAEQLHKDGLIQEEDIARAVHSLQRCWANQVAIVWTVDDVMTECLGLDEEEAIEVLQKILQDHNADSGVNWDAIRWAARELYGERAFASDEEDMEQEHDSDRA